MPWWFWILLWLFLLAASALFLVLCGIRLFRGFMGLVDEAGEAAARLHPPAGEPLVDEPPGASRKAAGTAALFRDPAVERDEYDAGRAARVEARRSARVARKKRRGQPQRISDLDLS
ncbi:hypothetical protein ACQ3I4_02615 [Zafaria sp. Z1313]|uniref:hypothetical protein n=1 Tax=unclassified Zafaria TaxID=2828765 RepID=UPI002E77EEE1|nr:hypothetical protein [Zafaria sp. J156]MEE1621205.1 hypothetical protein [Zafaria sp. J156]